MIYPVLIFILFFTSCTSVYMIDPSTNLTTGVVQREMRIGMSGADVASIFGSPNIVSLDEEKNEVWIYDKVSTEIERCATNSAIWLVIAAKGSARCSQRTSQKTLTVIIKFDENKLVKDFTYHSSRF